MPDFVISEHHPGDKAFLRGMLESAALSTYPELGQLGRLSLRERLDEIFDHHFAHEEKRIWLARPPAGAPAGMIWVQPTRHPVTELEDYMVLNLAVAPDFRRQGVARQLLAHARAYAQARGVKRLRLFVAADNVEAYTLYASLGFVDQTREMLLKL